jgi:hypothetical protein
MTDGDRADAIARGLNILLVGKEKTDILRAFGFIISSMALECPCVQIDGAIEDVRAAAEAHFAHNAKKTLQ